MTRFSRKITLDGLSEIDRLADELDLSDDIHDRSLALYHQVLASESDILRNRGMRAVTAACILFASRDTGDPLSASEIAEHADGRIDAKRILRTSKPLRTDLDLGILVADPRGYVERIADDVGASDGDRAAALDIVDAVVESGVASGRQANVIAAAAMYLAGRSDEGTGTYHQQDVADAADISTVAIRKNYPEFASVVETRDVDAVSSS